MRIRLTFVIMFYLVTGYTVNFILRASVGVDVYYITSKYLTDTLLIPHYLGRYIQRMNNGIVSGFSHATSGAP